MSVETNRWTSTTLVFCFKLLFKNGNVQSILTYS